MKTNKLSIFSIIAVLVLSITLFNSCQNENKTDDEIVNTNLRKEFLEGKNYTKVKSNFSDLSVNAKTDLWNEKLIQLQNQDFPVELERLINSLRIELKKTNKDTKIISDLAVEIAKIIPEEDYIKMFTELNDYTYSGEFLGKRKVSQEIINGLKTLRYNYNSQSADGASKLRPDCNCNWTCHLYGESNTNCKVTSSGCGFLWAFNCENHV